jgi:hypothetical protein
MEPSTMDNPEKLAEYDTQDEDKQNKNTTQQVLGTTLHKQTEGTQDEDKQNKNTIQYVLYTASHRNNVNKTRVTLQTTGGKDEPNIVSMKIILRPI